MDYIFNISIVVYGPAHSVQMFDLFCKGFKGHDEGRSAGTYQTFAATLDPSNTSDDYLLGVIGATPHAKVYKFSAKDDSLCNTFINLTKIFPELDLYYYEINTAISISRVICYEFGRTVVYYAKWPNLRSVSKGYIRTTHPTIGRIFKTYCMMSSTDFEYQYYNDPRFTKGIQAYTNNKHFFRYECTCMDYANRIDIYCPAHIGPAKLKLRPVDSEEASPDYLFRTMCTRIDLDVAFANIGNTPIHDNIIESLLLREDSAQSIEQLKNVKFGISKFPLNINPLMMAIKMGKVEECILLIEMFNYWLTETDDFNRSCMHYCVLTDNIRIFEIFTVAVSKIPRLSARLFFGVHELASEQGRFDVLRFLNTH